MNAAITDMESAWCCCARCKIHEGWALMLKLRFMLCVAMLPLVVVGCIKAASVSQCEATTPLPAWIMQPPPTGRHRWTGLFHPQREADHYAKTTWRNQKYINEYSADRVAHRWATHAIRTITALPAEYKCFKVIKPSNPFTNVCWVSVLTTFSAPPQILAASTVSLNSRNEEMMGDGFLWCYCCRFVLNSKRLLSTSCNKQGRRQ